MSKQVAGTGFATGLNWAAWRLANEDQLNGGRGNSGSVFNENNFDASVQGEVMVNWIRSIGDKKLRPTNDPGAWAIKAETSFIDLSTKGYTLAKILPRPDQRIPALAEPPGGTTDQAVFLGDILENNITGSGTPKSPIEYIMPVGLDGYEMNYALKQKSKASSSKIPDNNGQISSFSFFFSDKTLLAFQQFSDTGWEGRLFKNTDAFGGGGDPIDLKAPATGVEYGIAVAGEGYGVEVAINVAGGGYGVAVLGGSINGGTGDYLPAPSTVLNVPVTGGDGEDMTVDIDIDSGGIVTTVAINDSGNGGYRSGNILTIDNSGGAGGVSANFEALVTGNIQPASPQNHNDRRRPVVDSIIVAGDTYALNATVASEEVTATTNGLGLGYTNDTDVTNTRVTFTTDIAGVIIPSTLKFLQDSTLGTGDVGGFGFKTGDRFTVNGSGGTPLEFEIIVKNRRYNTVAVTGVGVGLIVDITYDVAGAVTAAFPVEPGSGYLTGDTVAIENENGAGSGTCVLDITTGIVGLPVLGGSGTGMTVDVLVDALGAVTQVLVNDAGAGYLNGDVLTIDSGNGLAQFGIIFVPANTEIQIADTWDRFFVKAWRDGADYKFKFTDRNKVVIFVEGSGLPIAPNAVLEKVVMFGGPRCQFDDFNIWNAEAGDAAQWTIDELTDDFEKHHRWMFIGNRLDVGKLTDGTGYATQDKLDVTASVSAGVGMKVDIIVVASVITFIRVQDQGKDYDFANDIFTIVQGGGSGGTFRLQGNVTKSLGHGADWTVIDTWIDTGGDFNDANFDDTTDGRSNTNAKSTTDRFGQGLLQSFTQMCADVGYTIQSVDGFESVAWRVVDPEGAPLDFIVQDQDSNEISKTDQGATGEEGVIVKSFLRGETGFDSIDPQPGEFGYNFLMKRP